MSVESYGILIGPKSTINEINEFSKLLKKNPRNYISQPTLKFSRVPVRIEDRFEGRHVDLRPFILYSGELYFNGVLPGGLTQSCLKRRFFGC